jgi:hypothetical protein
MNYVVRFSRKAAIDKPETGAGIYLTGYAIDASDGRIVAEEPWVIAKTSEGRRPNNNEPRSFANASRRLAGLVLGLNDEEWNSGKFYPVTAMQSIIDSGLRAGPIGSTFEVKDNGVRHVI